MAHKPHPHVHRHLEARGVDPKDVPDSVIATLNVCSEDELKAMQRVGASIRPLGKIRR